jgi:hypothetical protein
MDQLLRFHRYTATTDVTSLPLPVTALAIRFVKLIHLTHQFVFTDYELIYLFSG